MWLAISRAHSNAEAAKLLAEKQKAQDAFAAEQGATKAQVQSEREINAALVRQNASLAAFVAAMKKENRSATVASTSQGSATIDRTTPGKETPATATEHRKCRDAWGRIEVDTDTCEFKEHREVRVSAVQLRGLDGKSAFTKQRIEELDPVTHLPIPGDSYDVKITDFAITEEKGQEPGPFHMRAVAAVNERGAFGAGVKFFSWKSVDASALAFYDRADKSVRGAVQLGWRIVLPAFNSGISIGPQYFISSNGKSGLGAGLTLEVTR